MLNGFPKVRPALPDGIAKIYETHYKQNRRGETPASSLSRRMESWLHRTVASDIRRDPTRRATLEIGAGTLNQLGYEPEVGPYDVVEPFRELYEGSSLLSRVRSVYTDIDDVPEDLRYDRITAIAALEHICALPDVIAKSGVLLKEDGVLRASIPSEGTLLWTLGWKLTTGLEFRLKHGLDYGLLVKYEHVNNAAEIEGVLEYFFADVRCKVFGVSRGLSFYQFFACARPRLGRCREHLISRAGADV